MSVVFKVMVSKSLAWAKHMWMCCRYPNGCSYLDAAKQGVWKEGKQSAEGVKPWVMWHAACLQGLEQKGKAMQGLLKLRAQQPGKPRGKHPSVL